MKSRRRIAFSKALGLRQLSLTDKLEQGFEGSNPEPLMSALGQ
jgi:hypothetical protein